MWVFRLWCEFYGLSKWLLSKYYKGMKVIKARQIFLGHIVKNKAFALTAKTHSTWAKGRQKTLHVNFTQHNQIERSCDWLHALANHSVVCLCKNRIRCISLWIAAAALALHCVSLESMHYTPGSGQTRTT